MSIDGKQKRKRWNVQETKLLLKCYLAHKEEFVHAHKRLAYKHVLDDMIAEGFNNPSITILTLESKMRSLLHTYKMVKMKESDNTRTTTFNTLYMPEMEEIFGETYIAESDHILQIGISSEEAFDISRTDSDSQPHHVQSSKLQDPLFSKPELQIKESPPSSPYSQEQLKRSSPFSPVPQLTTAPTLPSSQTLLAPTPKSHERKNRRRSITRDIYYREKLKIIKKLAEHKIRERRRMTNLVVEAVKEIEYKKLKMLKAYLKSEDIK